MNQPFATDVEDAVIPDAAANATLARPPGAFLRELIDAGLLLPMGEAGMYGRGAVYEDVVERIGEMVSAAGAHQHAEVLRFPPAMTRQDFERSGYMKNFPDLAGTVHSFCGDERGHRRLLECLDRQHDWTEQQEPTGIVLTPAACYPVYPVIARRGAVPPQGLTIDVLSYCFRHEPSIEPTRMQLFRMREYIRIGTPEQVLAFREEWIERGQQLARWLGLPITVDVANDPFFGRAGKLVADSQRQQALKFELLIPVNEDAPPTACLSFNYHLDHFGEVWDIRMESGEVAHSACVGFGMERLALAMFRHHGVDPRRWPAVIREALWGPV